MDGNNRMLDYADRRIEVTAVLTWTVSTSESVASKFWC